MTDAEKVEELKRLFLAMAHDVFQACGGAQPEALRFARRTEQCVAAYLIQADALFDGAFLGTEEAGNGSIAEVPASRETAQRD